MSSLAREILENLRIVEALRTARLANAGLGKAVQAVKSYQQARFERTYADLLRQPRYAPAARFFLEDLYGPTDFAHRDAQFARIVPSLVRLFPREVVQTVATLACLHALSEDLDSAMGGILQPFNAIDAHAYVLAWRATDRLPDRARQVELTVQVGQALEGYTRNPLLRGSLRMMRTPARAAGLGSLQQFLEGGFDAFGSMKGAEAFLAIIAEREGTLIQGLFSSEALIGLGPDKALTVNPTLSARLP